MRYTSNRKEINIAIMSGLYRGLDAAAIHYQSAVGQALNGPSPSSPGSPPGKQTGALGRSAQIDRSGNKGKNPVVRVGTNLIYALIHELGGIINAKGGGLAVPVHPDAKRHSAKGGSARDLDLQFIPRSGKPPLLIRDNGGRWDVMYVLPKSVVMPARPAWRPTFKREIKRMRQLIQRGVNAAIDKAAGLGPTRGAR